MKSLKKKKMLFSSRTHNVKNILISLKRDIGTEKDYYFKNVNVSFLLKTNFFRGSSKKKLPTEFIVP